MTLLPSQSITFSLFFSGQHSHSPVDLFVKAFDVEPESVQTNRSVVNMVAPYIGWASGSINSFLARVQISHGRIDFVVDPVIPEDADPNTAAFAVPTDDAINFLLDSMRKVLPEQTNVIRLAIITNLIESRSSGSDAVEAIFNRVGIDFPEKDLTDVSYQLNKKLRLKNGILINRLLRYNVLVFQKMYFNGSEQVPVSSERFNMLLALDLNTVVDGTHFGVEQSFDSFALIAEETLRIANIGKPSALLE